VRLRDLEAQFNSKGAALSTALGEKQAREAQVNDLIFQQTKVGL